MPYVDAIYDIKTDKIHVSERVDGNRVLKIFKPKYEFFYDDVSGRHKSIYGNPVKKVHAKSRDDFKRKKNSYFGKQLYESDINVIHKCLEETYKGQNSPKLHTVLFS